MIKERLIIKNFGPIQSVDLELGKMTVLIGDNATGKSTIAKVLAICRFFSFIVDCGIKAKDKKSQIFDGLAYYGLIFYPKKGSIIEYSNNEYHIKITFGNSDAKVEFIYQSKEFYNLINKLELLKPGNNNNSVNDIPPIDFMWKPDSSFFELDVKKVMENPFLFPVERGLQSIFSLGNTKSINDSLFDQLSDIYNISKSFHDNYKLKLLDLEYKNMSGTSYVKIEDRYLPLKNSASGFQSIVPIELVIDYYSNFEKRKNRTFIIEEPENNLFPKTQKKLIEFFVENINNHGHQFILPTHSPYFLSSINDLLMAFKRGQKNPEEVEKIIKKDSWLNPKDLSVFQLKDGDSFDIFDKITGLIKNNIIDDVSDDMNDIFDELLDVK